MLVDFPASMNWYLHIDMDAFYVSVERVLNPDLEGKPVMVGGARGRGVVTSASYEARARGVRSAMPGYQARKLCPEGIFVPGRRSLYSDFSKRVFALLREYSPAVRAYSIDEGLVDLTGTERLMGHPLRTADDIIRRIERELRLPSSGGLASTRTLAKIAATAAKPRGLLYVPAGSEERFLAPLPVTAIPGIGPKTQRTFLTRGIHTIGQLLAQPGLRMRYLGTGHDETASPDRDHSLGSETTLERPVTDVESMERVLQGLIEEVAGRLRRRKLCARRVTVKIRYTNFRTITRSKTLQTPTSLDMELLSVGRQLLRRNLTPGGAIRLLGVSASRLEGTAGQGSIFEYQKRSSMQKLYEGIDRLRQKYGQEAIALGNKRSGGGHPFSA